MGVVERDAVVVWEGMKLDVKALKRAARVAANDTFTWWKTDLEERKRLEDEPVSLNSPQERRRWKSESSR